jgi:hypothetical protein
MNPYQKIQLYVIIPIDSKSDIMIPVENQEEIDEFAKEAKKNIDTFV